MSRAIYLGIGFSKIWPKIGSKEQEKRVNFFLLGYCYKQSLLPFSATQFFNLKNNVYGNMKIAGPTSNIKEFLIFMCFLVVLQIFSVFLFAYESLYNF